MTAFDDTFGEMSNAPDEEIPETLAPTENEPPFEEETVAPTPAPAFTSIDDLLSPPDDEPPVTPTPTPEPKTALRESFDLGHEQPTPETAGADNPQVKQLRDEFMKRLTSDDPTEAFLFAAQVGAAAAEQRLNARLGVIEGGVLRNTVEEFKAAEEKRNPKLFRAVARDFEAQVKSAEEELRKRPGTAVTQEQVREACISFYERAKGRALDRMMERSNAPATPAPGTPAPAPATPPAYAAPTGAAPPKEKAYVPKNDGEKQAIEIARAAGLNDDDIRDMFK